MALITDTLRELIQNGYSLRMDFVKDHNKNISEKWEIKTHEAFESEWNEKINKYIQKCREDLYLINDILMIEFDLIFTTVEAHGGNFNRFYSSALPRLDKQIIFLLSKLNKFSEIEKIELFIDETTSFEKVTKVKPLDIKSLLPVNKSENDIQIAFEDIIGENFHQVDWGGEINDIFTSFFLVDNKRMPAAFLLKGNGFKGKLTIKMLGKSGDQLLRLMRSNANIYIIQHVDEISHEIREDIAQKIKLKRFQGELVYYCIIDGTDTARILKAYGYLD